MCFVVFGDLFVSSRRRDSRCALVTGVRTCALPTYATNPPSLAGLVPLDVVEPRERGDEDQRGCDHDQNVEQVHLPSPPLSLRLVNENLNSLISCFTRRSEEHTSELQSLMRISYAVFCLKKKN